MAALLLGGVPFAFGKLSELSIPAPFDGAAYVYSAQKVLAGASLGVEHQSTARPGTLVVNLLGVWVFGYADHGPKVVQGVLQVCALAVSFAALYRVFGGVAAASGVTLAALLLAAPLVAKYGNVKEQYMIAVAMTGIGCLLLHRALQRRWLLVAAGGLLVWAPLFKETGVAAGVAVALFMCWEVLAGERSWREFGADLKSLLGGAALSLVPLYVWMAASGTPAKHWPYAFVVTVFTGGSSYVREGRHALPLASQAKIVVAYYYTLRLPIALALIALVVWVRRFRRHGAGESGGRRAPEAVVPLLGAWWVLDMALVWVSPRSYEEYYLPLNASASFLAAYLAAVLASPASPWRRVGMRWAGAVGGAALLVFLAWPVVFGRLPRRTEANPNPERTGGYVQRWNELDRRRHGSVFYWEKLAKVVRENTTAGDSIYVWGWLPGIYVASGRLAVSRVAFTSEMHVMPPDRLAALVNETVAAFESRPPKFVVDPHHRHFPWNRPPLELWPIVGGFPLAVDAATVASYESSHAELLASRVSADEAKRFEAMAPLRRFVMGNYRYWATFGEHVLFERVTR